MKEKRKNIVTPTSDDESDLVVNLDDIPNISDTLPSVKKPKLKKQNHVSQIPNLKDVDFKYLSELIHRVNNSAPKNIPPSLARNISPSLMPTIPFDTNDLKHLQNLKAQQTRRNFDTADQVLPRVEPEVVNSGDQTRNLNKPSADDEYYTNLGRQIASMIRNADTKSDHPFNTEKPRQLPFHSVLNENYYSPGSLWERSVRSPLPQISDVKPNINYLDESRTLKHSNEKSLLNLENEFATYASTVPSLSLQDLENLLNTVEKAAQLDHAQMKDPLNPRGSMKPSNVSLNVHLLPKYPRGGGDYRKFYDVDNTDVGNPAGKTQYFFQLKNPLETPKTSNISHKVHVIPKYAGDDPTYRRLVSNTGMLNPMEKTKYYSQLKNSLGKSEPSNGSFNGLMIPQYTKDSFRRLYGGDNPDNQIPTHTPQPSNIFVESKYITEQYQTLYPPKFVEEPDSANTSNKTMSQDMDTNNILQSRDYSKHNNHHVPIQLETETVPKSPVASGYIFQTQKPLEHDYQVQATQQMRQGPFVGVVVPNSYVNTPPPRTEYLQFLNSMPIIKQPSSQNREPKLMNQNNLNYFSRNKYHYMFEKQAYPILAPFRKQISKKYGNPSYFHHHLHHYEYFD
ncbi:uncharacterized protein LOC111354054 [Spodoptera litura]|uniref:Uncharacterized protein LOC111354054 n=1 Tax=Spodoptera litura TaxID=69820 RepID=A0A9J7IPZ0_SPOLT|nr:uncharacterized protein LOC111354054 [Spodoptera litura]